MRLVTYVLEFLKILLFIIIYLKLIKNFIIYYYLVKSHSQMTSTLWMCCSSLFG